jgi:GNAT superfamily N-acetyltransferase
MLVHRRARRRGLAQRLLSALEDEARREGKTVLVLDTVTGGDAERLYARGGWQRVGEIPNYALMPDGRPCATTYFHKQLVPVPA